MPGLNEKNIEVSVANGRLAIRGEKREEKEVTQKDYYISERSYGSFERHFGLPEGVDSDKIEASFKNGILKVTLPKTAEAQKPVKKIEVEQPDCLACPREAASPQAASVWLRPCA